MGFMSGLGAEGFVNGALNAYTTLNADARAQAQAEILNQIRQQQLQEALAQQAMRQEMQDAYAANKVNFFQGDELTPAGQKKLQGMMTPAMQKELAAESEYMAPGTNARDMAQGLTPGLLSELRTQGGEQKPLSLDQMIGIVTKYDPIKGATLQANRDKIDETNMYRYMLQDERLRHSTELQKYLEQGRNDRNAANNATRIEISDKRGGSGNGEEDATHKRTKEFNTNLSKFQTELDKIDAAWYTSQTKKDPMTMDEYNRRVKNLKGVYGVILEPYRKDGLWRGWEPSQQQPSTPKGSQPKLTPDGKGGYVYK